MIECGQEEQYFAILFSFFFGGSMLIWLLSSYLHSEMKVDKVLHTTNSYLITAKTQIMSQTLVLSNWFPLLRSLNLLCTPPTPLHSFIDPPIYILQQPNLSFSACFVLLSQPNQLLMNFLLPSSLLLSPFNLSFAHTPLHQEASPLSVCICVYLCVYLPTCFPSLYLNQGLGESRGCMGESFIFTLCQDKTSPPTPASVCSSTPAWDWSMILPIRWEWEKACLGWIVWVYLSSIISHPAACTCLSLSASPPAVTLFLRRIVKHSFTVFSACFDV